MGAVSPAACTASWRAETALLPEGVHSLEDTAADEDGDVHIRVV